MLLPLSNRRSELRQRVLTVTDATFIGLALDLFRYQAQHNATYAEYLHFLRRDPESVHSLEQIPFMPIRFFKSHQLLIPEATPSLVPTVFASSGTTGPATSRHFVTDLALYDAVCTRTFEAVYGPLSGYHVLGLLPSYLERNNSSLVYMVQRFMEQSGSALSGFYLADFDALTSHLRQLTEQPDGRNILLIGVTFGLLDWVEQTPDLAFLAHNKQLVVMETGGMKGRRREMLRDEVHAELTQHLHRPAIHSEYGMTELLSQAYSTGEGIFAPSATLRVLLRDLNDPFHIYPPTGTPARQTGGVNVIDLANLDSCAFIETQDLGQYVGTEGHFRIIGRFDNSDVRGCNLLIL
ncbi:acyl transferase [Fibrella sp. HMF5335]|uniref:Acyl transferase n=1 Tax=Fibrella rubiginis TaxID=2817060 RepID=A0A939GEC4_9BACT|nr:acyl transferase [Fibrella rubiginis]MBO0937414.1 acyl transferase [Fibrella rubiginis]